MGTFLLIVITWLMIGFAMAVAIEVRGWPSYSDIPDPPHSISVLGWPIVLIVLIAVTFAHIFENMVPNAIYRCAALFKKEDTPSSEDDDLKRNDLT